MKKTIRVTWLFMFCLYWVSCQPAVDQHLAVPPEALIVYGGPIIDGTGVLPLRDGCVVILNNRIHAVDRMSKFVISKDNRTVDAAGGTIMPGIINSHVHHGASRDYRKQFLRKGVTSVCDLGSPWPEIEAFMKEETSSPAARFFYAGPIVTAPGGYPDGVHNTSGFNHEVSNPKEGREAVRYILGRGADVIKVAIDPSWNKEKPVPMLDVKTAAAIVEEANARGVLVRAHMIQMVNFNIAIEANINVVEHMPFPPGWPAEDKKKEAMNKSDPLSIFFDEMYPEYDLLLTKMASQSMMMVPTVSALLVGIYGKSDLTIHQQFVQKAVFDIIRRFREAGGIIAVGNDFNGRGAKEMLPMTEMRALKDAGLTNMEVIVASTRYAARVCGQEDNLGTLEAEKLADIIIVAGNPLIEIEALARVKNVILDGKVIF